jgi:hypothetical protein
MSTQRLSWLLVVLSLAFQAGAHAQQAPKVREPFTPLQWAEPTKEEEIVFSDLGWVRAANPRVGDVVAFKAGNVYQTGIVSDPVKKLYIPEEGGIQREIPEGATIWHYIWR